LFRGLFSNAGPSGKIRGVGIKPEDFERMKTRLGATRAVSRVVETSLRPAAGAPDVVIGIDPSLRGTGYGIIRADKQQPELLVYGVIKCAAGIARSRCLLRIVEELRRVTRDHHPTVCAIEALFYAQNLQTTLIMGEARGAALFCMAEAGLDIHEIAPRKVKQAIVGYGAAQKLAVAKMIQRILRTTEIPPPDAADALAVALAHAQSNCGHSLNPPKRI
jgi:crossover junction endodeoxyribonuclease RuvC